MLNNLIKKMLEEHVGGERFFDNLDANLQNESILQNFYDKLIMKYWRADTEFIVSGKFGIFFANLYPHLSPIVVKGGLRYSGLNGELEYLRSRISGIKCVFIDDSFYMGRTRDAIQNEVIRLGGKVIKTLVIYDGSKLKDPMVRSLYRYYDHHPFWKLCGNCAHWENCTRIGKTKDSSFGEVCPSFS